MHRYKVNKTLISKINKNEFTTFTTWWHITTDLRAIKISNETYAELSQIAGELQIQLKRPVSIDEAIKHLTKREKHGAKISDMAGAWNMTDLEAEQVESQIDESWKKWRTPE